ncbi:MAG: class I SAM-dependent methyltransferase [Actinomycetota bacterium]|jgi:hypothetical protein|nr:class I SAM-dependent methyltransferase [Actinomycetota bacterium]
MTVRRVRPHHVFGLVETESCAERVVKVVLPGMAPTPLLLETAIIVAMATAVNPAGFLEIGTYVGVQTLNVALNLSDSAVVYTLDLDDESFREIESGQHPVDRDISLRHLGCGKLAFEGSDCESRIMRLHGDSKSYDFSSLVGKIDMVYIDGGHDSTTVRADTDSARRLLAGRTPSCIVWHDYGNRVYPELTRFLDGLSEEFTIYHVEETKLCFHVSDPTIDQKLANAMRSYCSAERRHGAAGNPDGSE